MRTAMQELKDKLTEEADRLSGAVHGTDQYGYRGALVNIILDIDYQMIEKEKKQIKGAYIVGFGNALLFDSQKILLTDEKYYNETFK